MRILSAALLVLLSGSATGQVPPSAVDVSSYSGLHAAAWHGDAGAVTGADSRGLETRDARGRTPLHVATFARRQNVIRALTEAGADLGALEHDRVRGHA